MGLRERQRQETNRLIRRAALQLARDQSIEAISVEMICKEAGVSQRTFFNYFPHKEAVFVVPPPPFPDKAVEAFLAAHGTLLDLLIDLLVAQSVEITPDRWMVEVSRRIMSNHPKIAALQFAQFHKFDTELATLIARRLGHAEANHASRILAAAVLGAMRVVLEAQPPGTPQEMSAAIRAGLNQLTAFAIEPSIVSDTCAQSAKSADRRKSE